MAPSRPFQLLRGLNELTQYLGSGAERVRFAAAPILLLSSRGSGHETAHHHPPEDSVSSAHVGLDAVGRHVQFRLQQQLGFRTVPTTMTTTAKASSLVRVSSFPTIEQVEETAQLATRLGATTIAAVGSSHSLHLAKALYERESSPIEELILIPATHEACLVAASSNALVYDTGEEVILPSSSSSLSVSRVRDCRSPIVMALPDESLFVASATSRNESLWAVMALALDHLLVSSTDEARTITTSPAAAAAALTHLVRALDLYQAGYNANTNSAVAEFLVSATWGNDGLIHFGVNHEQQQQQRPRSSPLAVAISVATAFESPLSQYSVATIMASLVPALVERHTAAATAVAAGNNYLLGTATHGTETAQNSSNHNNSIISQLSSMPTPTVVTNESLDTLMSYIRHNQVYWDCRDVSDDYFRTILRHHSFVD